MMEKIVILNQIILRIFMMIRKKQQKFDLFLKGFNVGYLNFEVAVKMNMTGQ